MRCDARSGALLASVGRHLKKSQCGSLKSSTCLLPAAANPDKFGKRATLRGVINSNPNLAERYPPPSKGIAQRPQ